jgi:formate hydrogenlyase subunit 4
MINAWILSACQTLLFVLIAPLLLGFLQQLKCWLQNRSPKPLLQPYRNLIKLFHKQPVMASNASFIFKFAPYLIFAVTIAACFSVPLIMIKFDVVSDVIVLVGLLALARFFLTLAGMDIGTAFGGMGSSREMLISSMAEPAMLLAFFTPATIAHSTNLGLIVAHFAQSNLKIQSSLFFTFMGFILVAVAETGRIPIDNPATHLELTMIHEAMILEYSGRHLALIEWAAQIKFMLYCVLIVNLFFPWGIALNLNTYALGLSALLLALKLIALCGILALAEINFAKLRLFRVPGLLNTALVLCLLGLLTTVILEIT